MTAVATDVRGHWAAPWILPVTQAGVMDVFPNHTFQPGAHGAAQRSGADRVGAWSRSLRRGSPDDLARWRARARVFADLAAAHLPYPAAALAVAPGAMTALEAGPVLADARRPRAPKLIAAIARIEQLAGR